MKFFLQIYYMLLFYVLCGLADEFINFPPIELDYIFFAKPLSFLKGPTEIIQSGVFLLALFVCLLSVFKPWKVLCILSSFFVLILYSILYAHGIVYHTNRAYILPFILSSVLVCFFDESKDLSSRQNFFVLRLIQGMLLSHYFMSGLWKLRAMISARFEFSLHEIAAEYIAYTFTEQNGNLLLRFLLDNLWLLSFGYFCVLIFELTALAPIFLNNFFKLYGGFAILFHLSSGVSLGIYFHPTILAVLFFLIIAEGSVRGGSGSGK